jgi:hypothetical protein
MNVIKQKKDIIKEFTVDDIIITELSDDSSSETEETHELDVGECCFCGRECNPMSQSCGYCARGISGAVIGLAVPYELQKFIFKSAEYIEEKTESDR